MTLVKGYCGLMLIKHADSFYCIDRYTMEIKKSGTLEECEEYLSNYIKEVGER